MVRERFERPRGAKGARAQTEVCGTTGRKQFFGVGRWGGGGGFLVRGLGGQGADQVDQVPAELFGDTITLGHHFSFAFGDDVEDFAVAHIGEGGGLAPIVHGELHRFDDFAFAVALGAMAHLAVVTKNFAGFGEAFGRGFDRVDARGRFGRNFVRRIAVLRSLPRGGGEKTDKQNGNCKKERTTHNASSKL